MADQRWSLEVPDVGSSVERRVYHSENEKIMVINGTCEPLFEAILMPDRERGPVTPPAAAIDTPIR